MSKLENPNPLTNKIFISIDYECEYVCIYVCVYLCIYVCMYVCIYVYMYVQYVCMSASDLGMRLGRGWSICTYYR
jgi:hypothetical protein